MKKNVKAMYVAPMVELLEARVEKGFAGSVYTPNTGNGAIATITPDQNDLGPSFED